MRLCGRLIAAFAFLIGLGCSAFAQTAPKAAVLLDPITAILDAFKTQQIVALGEGFVHGDEQALAFRLSLIRDPRFASAVNDLVIETGNARYQDAIDRYVRGEDVPYESLRHVWEDTTQVQVWGLPPGEIPDTFRTVRAVNVAPPRDRQPRVLLGDPPIEWEHVQSAADHRWWIEQRDIHAADVIQREVLAKGRRALVVYGSGHLQRKQELSNFDMEHPMAQTLISLVERTAPGVVFSIHVSPEVATLHPEAASWHVPSLVILRGTALGAADVTTFTHFGNTRFAVRDGKLITVPRDEWRRLRAEDQFDAIIYPGPASEITVAAPSAAFCSNSSFVQTLLARMDVINFPPPEINRLKQFCASAQ